MRSPTLVLLMSIFVTCLTLGPPARAAESPDRKSTRLNSSHLVISYAVFCLKKKKMKISAGRWERILSVRFLARPVRAELEVIYAWSYVQRPSRQRFLYTRAVLSASVRVTSLLTKTGPTVAP